MILTVIFIFVGVFTVVALLLMLPGSSQSSAKSTDVLASILSQTAAEKKTITETAGDFRKTVVLSAIPWINDWLQKFELVPRLRIVLHQADLQWTASKLLLMCAVSFAVPGYLVYMRTNVAAISLMVGTALGFVPLVFVWVKRSQRFASFEKGLPEALDLMVSALRAGHSLNAALGLVSRECQEPIKSEFRVCFDEQNYGLELRAAIDNLVARMPLQDLRIATTAILIQKETGGNLAEVLNNTSEVIRERFRLKRQVQVHTAHGRMTGGIIAALPIALLLILYLVNPSMESLLWKRELGVHLLMTAAGGMVIGGIVIWKIVNMDV
jgi:tight adherence protein B